MEPEPTAARFVDLFHQVYQRFHDRQPRNTRPLSPEALAVLEHLSRTGPLAVTEAADHFKRSQAAMSEILSRLETRGLVVRFADERDRRRHLVWLSEAGLAAWRRTQRVLSEELLEAAFSQLSERQRGASLRTLRALLDTALPPSFADPSDRPRPDPQGPDPQGPDPQGPDPQEETDQ